MSRPIAKPDFVFVLWCRGLGDVSCARDYTLEMSLFKRLFWRARGAVLMRLFNWWRWTR